MGKQISRVFSLHDDLRRAPDESGVYILKFSKSVEPNFEKLFGVHSSCYGGPWYYVGYTNGIKGRLIQHARGTASSRLTQFAYYKGLDMSLFGTVFNGTRKDEEILTSVFANRQWVAASEWEDATLGYKT